MRTAFIKLHISIVLAGFTGIFGKLIELPEGPLVWYRMLITSVLFYCYLKFYGKVPRLPWREVTRIGGVGALLGLHWIFFYASIKYANVSIGVVCFSLAGFFTAIFEPILTGRKISLREIVYSLITVAGIMLIFHLDTRYRTGIILGVISSALVAVFTIFNKRVGRKHNSTTMLFYEMTGGFAFLTMLAPSYFLFFPESKSIPDPADLLYLFLLSSLCTIGLYLLLIQALAVVSSFTVNLSYNLEPIYSIILAMLLFGEAKDLNPSFYIGLALICLSVVLQTVSALRDHRPPQSSGRQI